MFLSTPVRRWQLEMYLPTCEEQCEQVPATRAALTLHRLHRQCHSSTNCRSYIHNLTCYSYTHPARTSSSRIPHSPHIFITHRLVNSAFSEVLADRTATALAYDTIVCLSVCLSEMKCFVAKRYILQQNCLNNWIESALVGRWYYRVQLFNPTPTPHPQNILISLTTACGYIVYRTAKMPELANNKLGDPMSFFRQISLRSILKRGLLTVDIQWLQSCGKSIYYRFEFSMIFCFCILNPNIRRHMMALIFCITWAYIFCTRIQELIPYCKFCYSILIHIVVVVCLNLCFLLGDALRKKPKVP